MQFFIIVALLLSLASAEPREALLIGNYDYKYISVLDNPESNIKRLGNVLKDLNFNVKIEQNLNSEHLEDSIDKFANRLRKDRKTTGLLYYSGHGCQLNNRGYLLPTNVDSKKRLKVKYNALSIDEMLETLGQSGNRLNMLFLDACRDVPMGTKGGTKGLVQPNTRPKGSLIVYATESGKTADDNSNFINALIVNIQKPNEDISSVARNISNTVADITNDEQVPVFFEKRLPSEFVLNKVYVKPSLPFSVPKKSTESKKLQICEWLSYQSKDPNGVIDKKALQACKMVHSDVGKGYVARALYRLDKKEEAKVAFEKIKTSLEAQCNNMNKDACRLLGFYWQIVKENYSKSTNYDNRACELNDGLSCNYLGLMYQNGKGTAKDESKAVTLYQKACELDSGNGCNNLGLMYQNGKGTAKDESKALTFYEKGCTLDSANSCWSAGYYYRDGIGTKIDLSKARKFYAKACDLDSGGACNNLAYLYRNGKGVSKDESKALTFYEKSCELKYADSCWNVGYFYQDGIGTDVDLPKAIEFYSKACDLKSGGACETLAYLYRNGKGVSKDESKALTFYEKGCTLDSANSCWNAGYYYRDGIGTKIDLSKARKFYAKACDLNSGGACNSLAYLYRNGKGVSKDESKALTFYEKGCTLDSANSCWNAGYYYRDGIGTKIDLSKARKFYAKACDLNSGGACNSLAYLYRNGKGVSKDEAKALTFYEKSCELQRGYGCTNLGYMYEKGIATNKDNIQAVTFYKKGCELDSKNGCYNLALGYDYSYWGLGKDTAKAKEYYQKACKFGHDKACKILQSTSGKEKETFSLTINTTPSDAKVQIMNIKPKYKDGIALEKGEYKIRVSKEGYQTEKFDLILKKDFTKNLKLKKIITNNFDYKYYAREGNAFFKKKQYKKAINLLKKSFRLNPSYNIVSYNLGVAYQHNGNYLLALKNFKGAIKLKFKDVQQIHSHMANCYYNQGVLLENEENYDKALNYYKKAINIDPITSLNTSNAYYNIGVIYSNKRNMEEALKAFNNAKKLNPKDPDILKMIKLIKAN